MGTAFVLHAQLCYVRICMQVSRKTSRDTPVQNFSFVGLYLIDVLQHASASVKRQTPESCPLPHEHALPHRRAFVIQQQPAVIDWSICFCVAYKWATWYSALFIWNQPRQRFCVSVCCTRDLFLSLPAPWESEGDGKAGMRRLYSSLFSRTLSPGKHNTCMCKMIPAVAALSCQAY